MCLHVSPCVYYTTVSGEGHPFAVCQRCVGCNVKFSYAYFLDFGAQIFEKPWSQIAVFHGFLTTVFRAVFRGQKITGATVATVFHDRGASLLSTVTFTISCHRKLIDGSF